MSKKSFVDNNSKTLIESSISLINNFYKNEKQSGPTGQIYVFDSKKENEEFKILSEIEEAEKHKFQEFLKKVSDSESNTNAYIIDGNVLIGLETESSVVFNAKHVGGKAFTALSVYGIKNFKVANFTYANSVLEGLILASYKFDIKTMTFQKPLFFEGDADFIFSVKSQNFARFLMEIPSNLLEPESFAKYATLFVEYLKQYSNNLKIEVFDEEFMKKKGMNLLLSVNAGSAAPAKLIKITYKGKQSDEIDISLVGKGVTFDTGGVSLKPSLNMEGMKSDMGGAAVLLSQLAPIVKQKLPLNVNIILPMVINAIGPSATRPGDVIQAMNGKHVEIINTDAEGRLILADALSFAQEDNPKMIADMATLTGNIVVALGENYSGYFTNSQEISNSLKKSAEAVGEFLWEMPLNDDIFLATSKSNVADFRNIRTPPFYGGSSQAASFLHQFVDKKTPWVHLDIAASMDVGLSSLIYGKSPTAKPFATFFNFLQNLK